MEALPGLGVDRDHLAAHHPAQQVDAVDALVHEAAAVLGPGAPPGGLAVVAPVPVPPHVDRSVGHAPEATLLHGSADVAHGDVEAVLVAGRYLHAALLGAPHDLVGVGHRHRDGLLDYRVDARVDAVQRDARVLAALGGDGRDVQVRLRREHLAVAAVDPRCRAVPLRPLEQALGLAGGGVAERRELESVRADGLDVVERYAPAAYYCALHVTAPLSNGRQEYRRFAWPHCRRRTANSPHLPFALYPTHALSRFSPERRERNARPP